MCRGVVKWGKKDVKKDVRQVAPLSCILLINEMNWLKFCGFSLKQKHKACLDLFLNLYVKISKSKGLTLA